MTQYRDESHAVARALNAGEGRPKTASWQDQYRAGFQEGDIGKDKKVCDPLAGIDRLLADSMARALIHRSLKECEWFALLAMYSGDGSEQVKAVDRLATLLTGPSTPKNRRIWIGCWASAALAKKYGSGAVDWDGNATNENTLRRQRWELRRTLESWRQAAMSHLQVVLKDAGLIEG